MELQVQGAAARNLHQSGEIPRLPRPQRAAPPPRFVPPTPAARPGSAARRPSPPPAAGIDWSRVMCPGPGPGRCALIPGLVALCWPRLPVQRPAGKPTAYRKTAGSAATIGANCPGGIHLGDCHMDYQIQLPPGTALTVTGDAGRVILHGGLTRARVTTDAGQVSGTG